MLKHLISLAASILSDPYSVVLGKTVAFYEGLLCGRGALLSRGDIKPLLVQVATHLATEVLLVNHGLEAGHFTLNLREGVSALSLRDAIFTHIATLA